MTEAQKERRRARDRTPEYQAKRRAKQNRLFATSKKYRDRHRNYMRGYMRRRRAASRAVATANKEAP